MDAMQHTKRTCVLKRITLSRPTLADVRSRAVHRRAPRLAAAKGESSLSQHVPTLLGSALGLGMLLPGSSIAVDQMEVPQPTEVRMEAPAAAQAPYHQSLEAPQVSSDISAAPDLVTDMDVELAYHTDNPLVNGLEWMVEEGLEVTNFTESNFAAVGAPSSSMWLSNSPWCLVWDAYCNVLTTRPVATKLATGMVGTFLGDLLAQFTQGLVQTHSAATATLRGRSNAGNSSAAAAGGSSSNSSGGSMGAGGAFALDLSRTARLVGFSALVGTPVAFVWFNLLDQYVMPTDPTNPLAVFSKVALDQVLMAPCMTSVFFATMALLEGAKRREVADTVKAKLKPTLLANWTVWPIAHVVNFALVPPAQRILYINVINIAWTAFMSHMANSQGSSESKSAEQHMAANSKQLQQQAGR